MGRVPDEAGSFSRLGRETRARIISAVTALRELNALLQVTLPPERVLATAVETLGRTLKAWDVSIWLKRLDTGEYELAAQHHAPEVTPTERGGPGYLRLPIADDSEVVGELVIVPDPAAPPLSAGTQAELAEIASHTALTVHVVRMMHDLRRARERLVLAREEERRRLRRDLHDTIGPTLAALNLRAGALRTTITRDPALAVAEMSELREQIRSVITDIRRVVYNLRPPALDELGLLPAIREQAAQFSGHGLRVVVEAPEQLPPLPAAVEVAAYRIVLEALTNVARHAQARNCWIRLSVADQVYIDVTDDGAGLPDEHRVGVGISSMRERAAELGGVCEFQPAPDGGVRLLAQLPLNL
jgi:signal transduction histidine kinase